MKKEEVRKYIRQKKQALSKEAISNWSNQLIKCFMKEKEYIECTTIYSYVSYNQEVETHRFMEQAIRDGKKVAIPKILGVQEEKQKRYMEFCYITSLEELKVGYQGILEPEHTLIAKEEKALILMPGLAFDREYNRLGYGGGFYDKYLETHKENQYSKIALCFDFQLLEKLEVDLFDKKVDKIITPTQII